MKRNVELLQQTMQYIKDHSEQHDQQVFVGISGCGTVACFAGWAAILSGWSEQQVSSTRMWAAGAQLLGISIVEAGILFNSQNTRSQLELMVKDLVNGDELLPAECYPFKE
jgi:hypothetical protein